MKRNNRTSISLSDNELGILDAIAARLQLSRSEVTRHLLLYHGMCGGDFPLTTKILNLPEPQQSNVIGEIRRRAEKNDPAKPQSFRQWVKESLGRNDAKTVETGANILLSDLLKEYGNS